MLKKIAFIAFLYSVFTFVFLTSAFGYEGTAGQSAELQSVITLKNTFDELHFDLRQFKLQKFFELKYSPLKDHTLYILKTSDKYQVDWRLFPAIAGVESGYCHAYIKATNNCVGWGGGTIFFDSMEDQIDTVLKSLKKNYIDQGLVTVDLIGARYAADPAWSYKVLRNMNEIKETKIVD